MASFPDHLGHSQENGIRSEKFSGGRAGRGLDSKAWEGWNTKRGLQRQPQTIAGSYHCLLSWREQERRWCNQSQELGTARNPGRLPGGCWDYGGDAGEDTALWHPEQRPQERHRDFCFPPAFQPLAEPCHGPKLVDSPWQVSLGTEVCRCQAEWSREGVDLPAHLKSMKSISASAQHPAPEDTWLFPVFLL